MSKRFYTSKINTETKNESAPNGRFFKLLLFERNKLPLVNRLSKREKSYTIYLCFYAFNLYISGGDYEKHS